MRSTIFDQETNSPLATVQGSIADALAFYAERAGYESFDSLAQAEPDLAAVFVVEYQ
jgi:hypothetical protein